MAGVLNQEAVIYEAGNGDTQHQAVLRFRSSAVGEAVGIPFKKVRVYKGIFFEDKFVEPDIRMMNWYSMKVTGGLFDRSIADLKTEERWIAPEGFHSMLKKLCGGRIYYEHQIESMEHLEDYKHVISTIPIHALAKLNGEEIQLDHQQRKIFVSKHLVIGADLQQTIYFPDPRYKVYRATMTGEVLRIESMEPIDTADDMIVLRAFFGTHESVDLETILLNHEQLLGKLLPMDEQLRRNFIRKMSRDFGVYSLGRFATWRNILLDDVLHDIHQIRKMMTRDEYDFAKEPI